MAVKTKADYIESLKKMRPNVYKFGELIEDVTTHPATRRSVESHGRAFNASNDPKYASDFTTVSTLTGDTGHRWNSIMESAEDLRGNAKFKRWMFRFTGNCNGGLCVGWQIQNVMWNVTAMVDKECGTDYHKRLEVWVRDRQANGSIVAGALTDPKGDRGLKPSQQAEPMSYLRIKEVRPDGIVVNGCKSMIAGVAASNEIFVMPGSGYKDEDRDCAVSFAIPRDIKGLTIVEARHPSDTRDHEEGFDAPATGTTQAFLFFEDCFIPNERVFLCQEAKFTGAVIGNFTANYRSCKGACAAGQGDVMVGASTLMARINGLSTAAFSNKLVQMSINNETTYAAGLAAIWMGKKGAGGAWVADSLLGHIAKVHLATIPFETRMLCQDIGGGYVESGCFPASVDFADPRYGKLVASAMRASSKYTAETRARAARLSEWLTVGGGTSCIIHGGGSPDGAKMVVKALTPLNEYAEYARALAGIAEEVPEPEKKR
jgi:4-hydroxybutyryl-CoA dehydratase/vinylacetyl-CoA-Delta-isomerase